jgi:hypothetical protein
MRRTRGSAAAVAEQRPEHTEDLHR